jgi:hypothetical protein
VTAVDHTGVDETEGYHALILRGFDCLGAGHAARRADIFALRAAGLRPPAIARELERRARAAGCTDEQIARLGISAHNVRVVLRGGVAEGE